MAPKRKNSKNTRPFTRSHSNQRGIDNRTKHKRPKQRCFQQNNESYFCNPNMKSVWTNYVKHFTEATNWQQNYQVRCWKWQVFCLQQENRELREALRKNNCAVPTTSVESTAAEESDSEVEDLNQFSSRTEEAVEPNGPAEDNGQNDCGDEELEVSEEFIQFLIDNEKYRADARRERELLKAKLVESENIEPEPQETVEDIISRKKEFYGEKYKKVMALEMYLTSRFQDEVDKKKSAYWPVIPFRP